MHDLHATVVRVLKVLIERDYALYAEDRKRYRRGAVWPGVAFIAEKCCCSVRTVQRALRKLERAELITTYMDDDHRTTNVYFLNWDNLTGAERVQPKLINFRKDDTSKHMLMVTRMSPKACASAEVKQGIEATARRVDPSSDQTNAPTLPLDPPVDETPRADLRSINRPEGANCGDQPAPNRRNSVRGARLTTEEPPARLDEPIEKPSWTLRRMANIVRLQALRVFDDPIQDRKFWDDVRWYRQNGKPLVASWLVDMRRGMVRIDTLDQVRQFPG